MVVCEAILRVGSGARDVRLGCQHLPQRLTEPQRSSPVSFVEHGGMEANFGGKRVLRGESARGARLPTEMRYDRWSY